MIRQKDLLASFFEVLGKYPLNEIIARSLRFYFRNPYESITIVDENSRVQFMDKSTEQFFGISQGGALGRDIRDFIVDSNLARTIATGKPVIGGIWEAKGIRRICSVYPLTKDGKMIGAIGKIIFHSLEEIERVSGEVQKLKKELKYFKEKEKTEYSSVYNFTNIIGNSRLMTNAIQIAKKIAPLDTDILIVGESGTGKELFAQSIHSFARASRPFIRINCAAIPFELAESQLFGYEKGAFTGASSVGKPGAFEAAEDGTVFLDEISSLPLSIQAKLLRVLQEREVVRLGSTKTRKLSFRSIAATNIDLKKLVTEGKFRHDLYYRVARATLNIPSLRERREDIPLYLTSFLKRINQSFRTNIDRFSDEALDILVQYDWPGNVRELINVLEQIAIRTSNDDEVGVRDLPEEICLRAKILNKARGQTGKALGIRQHVTTIEREMILSALEETGGNKRKAAKLLKMPRSTFYKKLNAYNIQEDPSMIRG